MNTCGNVLLPHVAVPVSGTFVIALVVSKDFGPRAIKFDLWVGQLAGLMRSRPWVVALEDLRQKGSFVSAGLILAAGAKKV